ncbi:MAG: glycosyltransferase, partial [Candidatus Hydrogenedentes bacterium]|nr:glycosyltransferase [Candidatus Hydrogenedentota bacterium]
VEVQAAALRGGGQMGDAFRGAGIKLHEGLLRHRFDLRAVWRVVRLIRCECFDAMILVDVYRNAMFCGLWGARLSGRSIRRILWCSAVPTGQAGNFVPRVRKYLRSGMLREIVCVSRWQREVLTDYAIPANYMRVIHNGVDTDRFAGAAAADVRAGGAEGSVLVHVANVMPDKDFDTLLAAAQRLLARRGALCLLLVGRGTDAPEMRRLIEALGLTGMVRPLGLRSDVPEILATAEAMVLSTRSEVFNVSVLEAMAAGTPVITSDVPGFEEMFEDGREGLKTPPGDADALAAAIDRLLGDPELRARLSIAGRRRAEKFRRESMCEKFLELLRPGDGGDGALPAIH